MSNLHLLLIPSWYPTVDNPIYGIFIRQQAVALRQTGMQVGAIYPHYRSLRLVTARRRGWRHGFFSELQQGVPTETYYGWSFVPGFPYVFHKIWLHMGQRLFDRYVKTYGLPDLMHAHAAIYGGILAARLSEQYNLPYVITEHSSAYALGRVRTWQLPLIAECLQKAKARLVVSPSLGKQLENMFGDAARPWQWMPNIVDPDFVLPFTMSEQRSRQTFRFLNIAHLTKNKGQDTLLQAFANQFRHNNCVELRLAGDGPLRDQLAQLAKLLGIEQQVQFLGELNRQEILHELQAADTVVLSSQYETFGVVLIEALACGKPIISTACGGPEYIVNAGNGRLVPTDDPVALGDALGWMRENAHLYDGAALHADCLSRYGAEVITERLIHVFQRTIRDWKQPQVLP